MKTENKQTNIRDTKFDECICHIEKKQKYIIKLNNRAEASSQPRDTKRKTTETRSTKKIWKRKKMEKNTTNKNDNQIE